MLLPLFSSYILSVYRPSRYPRSPLVERPHFGGEKVTFFQIFKNVQNFIWMDLQWSKNFEQNSERYLAAYIRLNIRLSTHLCVKRIKLNCPHKGHLHYRDSWENTQKQPRHVSTTLQKVLQTPAGPQWKKFWILMEVILSISPNPPGMP